MSAVTMSSDLTISILTLPTAGVGGSYYDKAFPVPVYPNAPSNLVTWRTLDNWSNWSGNYIASQGIATGLVWATLTYVLALTSNQKRATPFHTFMLLGLIFLLIHKMVDIISSLTPGIQPSSAYTALTGDIADSVWTRNFIATFAAGQVAAWHAFALASTCLWLQARGLMTGLKVRFSRIYKVILSYLALTSIATLSAAMSCSIYQFVTIFKPVEDAFFALSDQYTFRVAYLACYTISIGSYSLVSMISVVDIVRRRPTSISGGSAYTSALNLVGLLSAQSFAIPFAFCLMQILPKQTLIVHPEVVLLPTVYMILPLGSLFMAVNSNPCPNTTAPRAPILPPRDPNSPTRVDCAESDVTPADRAEFPITRLASGTPGGAHVDLELRRIDDMECSVVGRREPFAWPEVTLSRMDSQEKEVVTPETTSYWKNRTVLRTQWPASSQDG